MTSNEKAVVDSQKEIDQKHKVIRVSKNTLFGPLFCLNFGRISDCCFHPGTYKKYKRLYRNGQSMLEKDMNLINTIKDVKTLMTLSKCQNVLNDEKRYLLQHTKDNIIDLDSDTDGNKGFIEM